MNKSERRTIENVVQRLSEHKKNIDPSASRRPSREVLDALKALDRSGYLTTWIVRPLELLLKDDRTQDELALAVRMSNV